MLYQRRRARGLAHLVRKGKAARFRIPNRTHFVDMLREHIKVKEVSWEAYKRKQETAENGAGRSLMVVVSSKGRNGSQDGPKAAVSTHIRRIKRKQRSPGLSGRKRNPGRCLSSKEESYTQHHTTQFAPKRSQGTNR